MFFAPSLARTLAIRSLSGLATNGLYEVNERLIDFIFQHRRTGDLMLPPALRRSSTTTSAPRLVNSSAISEPMIAPAITATSQLSLTRKGSCIAGNPLRRG